MISAVEPMSMSGISGSLIDSRWRHKGTGDVIRVRQVHRADRLVEALLEIDTALGPVMAAVSFHELAADYEILLRVMR